METSPLTWEGYSQRRQNYFELSSCYKKTLFYEMDEIPVSINPNERMSSLSMVQCEINGLLGSHHIYILFSSRIFKDVATQSDSTIPHEILRPPRGK